MICMFAQSESAQRHMVAEFGVSRGVFITEAGLEELKWWSGERCVNSEACFLEPQWPCLLVHGTGGVASMFTARMFFVKYRCF